MHNDADQDGYNTLLDCNDSDANINPDATETPYDGVDNDCNILTLDDDLDEDGYFTFEDCNDADPSVNPNAEEIPNNDIDENCDEEDLITAVEDLAQPFIKLFPNPVKDILVLQTSERVEGTILLYNSFKSLVFKTAFQQQATIQMEGMPSGVYFIVVMTKRNTFIQKVIKQ